MQAVRPPAVAQQPALSGLVHRQVRRTLQGVRRQARAGQDLAHSGDMEVLAGVAGRRQREQFPGQVQAAAQHRRRLDRLVRRPGEDRLGRRADRQCHRAVRGQHRDAAAVLRLGETGPDDLGDNRILDRARVTRVIRSARVTGWACIFGWARVFGWARLSSQDRLLS